MADYQARATDARAGRASSPRTSCGFLSPLLCRYRASRATHHAGNRKPLVQGCRSSTRSTSAGFYDANGDGDGDLIGLTSKLDYLQELGIDCLWLMPIYASPLKDDGYDIADFRQIHPTIGTVADFEALTKAAHARGIRIIADLVVNHTSDQHPWFQEARRDPHSPKRNYYVWSDTDQMYKGTRIIFRDTETSNWTWDPVARQYFWHRFYSHQPDLNYDNPGRPARRCSTSWPSGSTAGSTGSASMPSRTSRARGDELREPARDARVPQGDAAVRRHAVPGDAAAGRGQPVAERPARPTSATATSSTWRSTSR